MVTGATTLIALLTAAAAAAAVVMGVGATSPGCKSLRAGISEKEREMIVASHNEERRRLADGRWDPLPSATDMMKLRWNPNLANVAQKNVESCGREESNLNSVSVILVTKELQDANWTNVIRSLWYTELKKFLTPEMVNEYKSQNDLFSYVPLAWSDLYQIGCGYNAYQLVGVSIYHMYLCIYGPLKKSEEEMNGKRIYSKGEPCTECPFNTHCSQNDTLCDFSSDNSFDSVFNNDILNNSTDFLASNAFPQDSQELLTCTFDTNDCLTKSIGTNQWQLHSDQQDSNQKFYEVGISRGGNSVLFILNGISPAPNGIACLYLKYRKYPINGSQNVPLKIFSWSLMGPPIETSISEDAMEWIRKEIPIQGLKGYAIVFFHLSVPNDPDYTGVEYVAIDDVRIVATQCDGSGRSN